MTETKRGTPMEKYITDRIKVDERSGCWLWTRALTSRGYASMMLNKIPWLAHRFSYSIFRGEIPKGMFVCHKCDVPKCVNPEHLFLGNSRDNLLDSIKKGRRPKTGPTRGECKNSSLTYKQVQRVRDRLKIRTGTILDVARSLKLPYHIVSDIHLGRRY